MLLGSGLCHESRAKDSKEITVGIKEPVTYFNECYSYKRDALLDRC